MLCIRVVIVLVKVVVIMKIGVIVAIAEVASTSMS